MGLVNFKQWAKYACSSEITAKNDRYLTNFQQIYVVVNFLFQLIFIFPLFWGMVMYANEFKTKEKQKLTEIKN